MSQCQWQDWPVSIYLLKKYGGIEGFQEALKSGNKALSKYQQPDGGIKVEQFTNSQSVVKQRKPYTKKDLAEGEAVCKKQKKVITCYNLFCQEQFKLNPSFN